MILRKKYHTLRSNKVRFFCDQPPETGYRGSGVHPGQRDEQNHSVPPLCPKSYEEL